MTYLKVFWKHDHSQSPIELYSELDSERYEVRKVERFRDGHLQFAGPEGCSGDTWLGETPLHDADVIAQNPVFTVYPLTAEEFEPLWRRAVVSIAA